MAHVRTLIVCDFMTFGVEGERQSIGLCRRVESTLQGWAGTTKSRATWCSKPTKAKTLETSACRGPKAVLVDLHSVSTTASRFHLASPMCDVGLLSRLPRLEFQRFPGFGLVEAVSRQQSFIVACMRQKGLTYAPLVHFSSAQLSSQGCHHVMILATGNQREEKCLDPGFASGSGLASNFSKLGIRPSCV